MKNYKVFIGFMVVFLVVFVSLSVAVNADHGHDKGKKLPKHAQVLQTQIDTNTTAIENIELTPGLQGEQGEQGVQGDKGDPGDQGIQGVKGVQGDQGDKGDTVQGPQGEPGTSSWTDGFETVSTTGSVQIGSNTADGTDDCNEANAGTIRFTGTTFLACDGTVWKSLRLDSHGGHGEPVVIEEEPLAEGNLVTVTTSGVDGFEVYNTDHTYSDPVVIAQPPSYYAPLDNTAAHVRLRNVGASSFKMKIEEWSYEDAAHTTPEVVGYLVFERGEEISSIDGEKIAEVGKVSVSAPSKGTFEPVTFNTPFCETPVIFAQVQTYNDTSPVVVRIRNVTATGFEVLLQEEEGADGIHAIEDVGYLAFMPGHGEFLGRQFKVGTQQNVDENFSSISFSPATFGPNPPFIATMQTFNDSDTAGLRFKDLTTNGVQVKVEEEESSDSETDHAGETVGYLVIERGDWIYK